MNGLKTAILLGALSGILVLGGGAIAGENGLYLGLGLAVLMNFFSYFFSDKIALASYSAQPVSPTENPEIYARVGPMVQNLATKMGLPMPKLWLIPDDSPNALPRAAIRHMPRSRSPMAFSKSWTTGNSKASLPTNWATFSTMTF